MASRPLHATAAALLALLLLAAVGCSGDDSSSPPATIAEAREATRENPDDPEAWRSLATLLRASGDRVGAIAALERYSTLEPGDIDAYRERGVLSQRQGLQEQRAGMEGQARTSFDNAVRAYRDLVEAVPDDPYARIELARAAVRVGDRRTAIASYEAFLRLAPENPNAPIVRHQLAELRQAGS